MTPRGKSLKHPTIYMLLQYAQNGYLVGMVRVWTTKYIEAEAAKGSHMSTLILNGIKLM